MQYLKCKTTFLLVSSNLLNEQCKHLDPEETRNTYIIDNWLFQCWKEVFQKVVDVLLAWTLFLI